jgi:hypothetical protein
MGMDVDPHSPVHRRRLRWPGGPDPPWFPSLDNLLLEKEFA